jgi:hypothetical protein
VLLLICEKKLATDGAQMNTDRTKKKRGLDISFVPVLLPMLDLLSFREDFYRRDAEAQKRKKREFSTNEHECARIRKGIKFAFIRVHSHEFPDNFLLRVSACLRFKFLCLSRSCAGLICAPSVASFSFSKRVISA